MAKRDTTVSASVTEQERKEWENASKEYGSISRMVRLAVGQLLDEDESDSQPVQGGLSPEVEDKIDTILERTESVDRGMEHLRDRTQLIHEEVRKTPEDTKELAGEIFDVLPRETELLGPATKPIDGGEAPIWTGEYIRTGEPEDIAEHLGVSLTRVNDALTTLQEDHHMVQSMTVEDSERYYKDV